MQSETGIEIARVEDFFLARQPILDRDQALVAYELLFRRASYGEAEVFNDLSATASVIAHASELGMDQVMGSAQGFFNVDAAVLTSEIVTFLPPQKVVLEILETVQVTPQIVARVAELHKAGYQFALDDVVDDSEGLRQLLPYLSIIKIDIAETGLEKLAPLCARLKGTRAKLLAEKVETQGEFTHCLALGFDLFQGYYFARPVIIAGKKLTPSQLTMVHILALLDADADTAELERSIKRDAAIGISLLRMVNTPAVGAPRRIDNLGQALMVLGRAQLQRWLQIMFYVEQRQGGQHVSPLLAMATTRGKLMELMAQNYAPRDRALADRAFAVGIMSLMDALFGISMADILEHMPVADEVRVALVLHDGMLGDMLHLVEYLEHMHDSGEQAIEAFSRLHLTNEDLAGIQLDAYMWSDAVAGAY
ncbi:MAG: EAL domain-containing protein [Burkholderiaceae bacterium]|nr:EAL domain-containing protein [Burkholderiaceae bacterium]